MEQPTNELVRRVRTQCAKDHHVSVDKVTVGSVNPGERNGTVDDADYVFELAYLVDVRSWRGVEGSRMHRAVYGVLDDAIQLWMD